MEEATKAYQIMTVHGRPVIHVPESWGEDQVASLVHSGFGIQFSGRRHEVIKYTGDVDTMAAYTELVMDRIAGEVKNHPLARKALLDVVDTVGVEIVIALDFYALTAAELSQIYTQAYKSDARLFHRALQQGEIWEHIAVLRKLE